MKIDTGGRVTIPAELRRAYGLQPGDELDVVVVGPDLQIVLPPHLTIPLVPTKQH